MKKYITYGLITSISINAIGSHASNTNGPRLYGTPGSLNSQQGQVTNKLKLKLSQTSVPAAVWQDIEKLSKAWSLMGFGIHAPADQQKLLQLSGLDQHAIEQLADSHEFQLLKAMSDPLLLDLAKNGDYAQLLLELKALGLITPYEKSALAERFQALLEKDAQIRAQVQAVMTDVNDNQIYKLQQLLGPGDRNEPACVGVAACVTLVAVATYIIAAVNVAVAVNVAAWISVAVEVAVATDGKPVPEPPPGTEGVGFPAENTHWSIGQLDRATADNLAVLNQFSLVAQAPALRRQALLDYKKAEARAVLTAAENLGMLTIKESERAAAYLQLDLVVEEYYGEQ